MLTRGLWPLGGGFGAEVGARRRGERAHGAQPGREQGEQAGGRRAPAGPRPADRLSVTWRTSQMVPTAPEASRLLGQALPDAVIALSGGGAVPEGP